ncbi:MAG: hypothetical protein KI790_01700 [Cyclobacteriaceae bacterium]|nr:hypothetical protein [Cyclobacteriaceae bacterium HetDA_MAG_MS6]
MKNIFFGLLLLGYTALLAQDRITLIEQNLLAISDSVPGLQEAANISIANASLRELLRAVAESHSLNISIDRVPEVTVTNNFQDVKVFELLSFVCHEYTLDLRLFNNIILIKPYVAPSDYTVAYDSEEQLLSYHLSNDTLSAVARSISDISDFNVVVSPDVRNQLVSGFIDKLGFHLAIEQLAASNNLELKQPNDNVYTIGRVTPANAGAGRQNGRGRNRNALSGSTANGTFKVEVSAGQNLVSVDASNSKASEVIKSVCQQLNIGYVFLSEPNGNIDCHLVNAPFADFLRVALSTSTPAMSFSVSDEIYLIGDSQNSNIFESRVFQFKNRSVEAVVESVPAQLKGKVEIQEFLDLNALILTGSQQEISKVSQFLQEIDKPVPNILIEVMVVEINKGYALNTGIKGVLGDSVPRTAGSVFPGIDLTLSSSSINRFLQNIDKRGVINLGRVTPSFYATIQALENNNNLNLRSTPKLSTLNGHEATLTIGRSVYYLIETQNVTGGVNPIVTVTPRYEKVEANLQIKIKPFVSFNEYITLAVEAEFSDFIAPTVEGAPPGNATRKFLSQIRIKNEEMIVVGGLEEATKSETASGVPLLSRLPVLKWIFSSKSKENADNKLLIFIKPTIVY